MKKQVSGLVLALSALQLGACASSDGRPRVMSSNGINDNVVRNAELYDKSAVRLFVETAEAAYPSSHDATPDVEAQRRFLDRGFALVKDRCRIYLSAKADRQRDVNVWRDSFAPITALTTGLIGLADGGDTIDSDYLVALGLATSAATSGFEIYEDRYLFGAQNVDAVRSLIEKALKVDADDKLKQPDAEMSYTNSVDYIVGNQLVCSPHNIRRLVNEAIKAGDPVPINRDKGTPEGAVNPVTGLKLEATHKPEGVEVI